MSESVDKISYKRLNNVATGKTNTMRQVYVPGETAQIRNVTYKKNMNTAITSRDLKIF